MRKIILLVSAICMMNLNVVSFKPRINEKLFSQNSQSTAASYGFNVSNLVYEYDYTYGGTSVYSGNLWFNTLYLWAGVYSYCPQESNSKFYFLLTYNKLTTNPNTISNDLYRTVSRELFVNLSAAIGYTIPGLTSLNLRTYTPETYGGSSVTTNQTWESGLSSGVAVAGTPSISFSTSCSVSYGITVYQDNVILTPTSYPWSVEMDYSFIHPNNISLNNYAPYRGDFIQRCVAVFEIENYQVYSSSMNINFGIHTFGTTTKYSIGNDSCWAVETKTSYHNHLIDLQLVN